MTLANGGRYTVLAWAAEGSEAADPVLADDDFASFASALPERRTGYDDLRTVIS